MKKKKKKSGRTRVDLYPPVSTKLINEAAKDGRTLSGMASRIIDKAIPDDARPEKQ